MRTCPGCKVEKLLTDFALCKQRANGLQVYCRTCSTAKRTANRAANPDRDRASRKAWALRNPDCEKASQAKYYRQNREARYAANRAWRAANPDQAMTQNLRSKYGMTVADYRALWNAQFGACAICTDHLKRGGTTHVDHDHATGKVRGLLCGMCNRMLGQGKDSATVLRLGAIYLDHHAEKA